MTHKEWFARPDLVEEFAGILRTDTLKLALEVVMMVGLPKPRLRSDTPNLMENHALLNAKREGYFECLQNIKTLAVNTDKKEADAPAWKHAKSEYI